MDLDDGWDVAEAAGAILIIWSNLRIPEVADGWLALRYGCPTREGWLTQRGPE